MLRIPRTTALLSLSLALTGAACSSDATIRTVGPRPPSASESVSPYRYSYLIVGKASQGLPASLETDLLTAGGTLTATIPQIGLAIAESERADFADAVRLEGVEAVRPDVPMTASGGAAPEAMALAGESLSTLASALVDPPIPPGGDPLSGLQWALRAIQAPEAWALGYSGRGVRVAVLDAGIQSTHPDLSPNLNKALSTSFVPGETYDGPPGPHGTQVSGIIAAARNGIGTVGVAPNAELVAIKILTARTTGPLSRIAQGLVYAADIGAQVANISAGTNLPRSSEVIVDDRGTPDPTDDVRIRITNDGVLAFIRALSRATQYAHARGVLIIAAGGNIDKDFDHAKSSIGIPQELPHVVTVGPTGPVGWALDHDTDLDVRPSYSNYGQSYLTLSAPGGNFDVFTRPGLPPSCTLLTFTWPCQVFDIVLTTGLSGGVVWNFGGSFAAPHAAGVAALIFEKLGAGATPDQVEAILRQTADDLGKPGNDDFYGHGRVNALRAVTRDQ
jgi:subtilisin family serine protease